MQQVAENKQDDKSPWFFEYVNDYINLHLIKTLKRSNATITAERDSLTLFLRYITQELKIDFRIFTFSDCDAKIVRGWLEHEISVKGNAEATRNQRLVSLRNYILYASEKSVSAASLYLELMNVPYLTIVNKIKEILNDEQISLIIRQNDSSLKGKRNKVMLYLLYETAVRVSELVNIKLSDLTLEIEHPQIHIFGKGKRHRNVYISNETREMLQKYVSIFHNDQNIANEDPPLFFSMHNFEKTPLTNRAVQKILSECANKAREINKTIPSHVHPHMFRRSKACKLYQNGTSILTVASILGHSSIETTSKSYARPSDEQQLTAINKTGLSKQLKLKSLKLNDSQKQEILEKAGIRYK